MEADQPDFILKGYFRNLVTVNIFAVIAGIGMLFLIYKSGIHYGLGFFTVGSFILFGWLFADAVVWHYRGVHELHIGPGGIRVIRGYKRKEVNIAKEQIIDIFVYKKGFRKNLNIMLGQQAAEIPGIITFYPGKRIQMFSDAFNDSDFNEAIERLNTLHSIRGNDQNQA